MSRPQDSMEVCDTSTLGVTGSVHFLGEKEELGPHSSFLVLLTLSSL